MGKCCPLRSLSIWVPVFSVAMGVEQNIPMRKCSSARRNAAGTKDPKKSNTNTRRDFQTTEFYLVLLVFQGCWKTCPLPFSKFMIPLDKTIKIVVVGRYKFCLTSGISI